MSSPNQPSGIAYRALDKRTDEFRLLYLKPALGTPSPSSDDDLVVAELHHYLLDEAPSFTALSYCWGQATTKKPLIIDGKTQTCGVNAEAALRHHRTGDDVYVWIDQLCINQVDDAEKSHQVQMMLRIYVAASRVTVWLGPSDDESDILIPHIRAMSALLRDNNIVEVVRNYNDAAFLRQIIHAFRAFLKKEYWKRVWIIQEFAVARQLDILCGGASIGYDDLKAYLLFLNQIYQHFPVIQETGDYAMMVTFTAMVRGLFMAPEQSFLMGVFARRRRHQLRLDPSGQTTNTTNPTVSRVEEALLNGGESLFAVLCTTSVLEFDYNHPQVTDPRDRIFAVMHFAHDVGQFSFLPDYSLSCEEVYEGVARRILEQGNVDLLSYCQFPQESPLATWAPDWRRGIKRPCVGTPWLSKFCSSGDSSARQSIQVPDAKTVLLRGVHVDTIQETGNVWDPCWLSPLDCTAALAYIDEVKTFCQKSSLLKEGVNAGDLTEAMRICIADRWHYTEAERQPELVQGFQEALTKMEATVAANDVETTTDGQAHGTLGWDEPWFMFAMKNLHTRRPFISTSGYVGLVPMHAQQGDKVVIFFGGKTPYVIRTTNLGVQLIGEAYVHGIMYGEFMADRVDTGEFALV